MTENKYINTISLDNLTIGEIGIIKEIKCCNYLKRRLYDLGLIKGAKIKKAFISPGGDPIAYKLRNTFIALRKEDCRNINININ